MALKSIKNGDLLLRPVDGADLSDIWHRAYDTDEPQWMKWNGPYFNEPKYSLEQFTCLIGPSWVESPKTYLVLYQNQIIGAVSWEWEDGELKKWLEFGVVIFVHEYWNQGLGTEICRMWIHHIFSTQTELLKIGFTTWSGNYRMVKIGKKLNMMLEANIRKVRYYEGEYFDSISFGLLREEWLTSDIFRDLFEKND
ncbi:GNAT family N-acetyltransferase [Vagococcus elongatus]|uniref:N-acetyltransferase domain-containing protein n=1 Tax=Vagococcus elongatus TaxID=180344 RepID=A0A430AQW9_9ENTE|nr:GNAT family protein [Vagococcus elongatus]RSU10307.1 hypothetical protein CBF29_09850 [Vagococcus elongatus]